MTGRIRFLMGLMLLSITFMIYAQDITGNYYGMYDDGHMAGDAIIQISKTEISINIAEDMYSSKESSLHDTYQVSGFPPFEFLQYHGMRWLLLYWPNGIYIEMKSGYYCFLSSKTGTLTAVLEDGWDITSSSSLRENGTNYSASNLSYMKTPPWASGHGYGIGDRINIKLNRNLLPMLIENGFVSIGNPKLYFENSRLKRFKLTSLKTGKSKEVIINDEPSFQKVEIRDIAADDNAGEMIFLDVLDIYKGTKYKDLCIQRIIPDFSEKTIP